MESNGKGVAMDGSPLPFEAGEVSRYLVSVLVLLDLGPFPLQMVQ